MAHTILRSVDVAFIRPGREQRSECIVSQCPIVFNGLGGLMPQEQIFYCLSLCPKEEESLWRSPARRRQCAVAVSERFFFSFFFFCFFPDDWRSRVESSREQLSGITTTLHPRLILEEVLR